MEEGGVRVDLDKLPIKRLEAIDEAGNEHYPPDTSSEEQRLTAIRRIDFSWVIEKDAKKAKNVAEADTTQQAWPWQGLMESLQQAQQELTVVIDLIGTVEANDAVAVASTTKPKSQPNETLVDMAVSAATKLQRLRHLSRYFKQSAKTMEQQFQKETRFYSSLIRLQQNWKVKRQRVVGSGPGSEGFIFDLADCSQLDTTTVPRLSPSALVPIDQESSGTLSVQIQQKSFRSLSLQFRGGSDNNAEGNASRKKGGTLSSTSSEAEKDTLENDDVNKSIKHAHSILRNIQKSIFEEQVFDMVIKETFIQSQGIHVTGMCEDFLQLAIGHECSLCLLLVHSGQNSDSETAGLEEYMDSENAGNLVVAIVNGKHESINKDVSGFPNPKSLEIYLLHMFHENILRKTREKSRNVVRYQIPAQAAPDNCGLLGHFCMTVAHRIFSNKVHLELESVVSRVPYLHLRSLPTWHSRTSSWSLCLIVPQPILAAGRVTKPSDNHEPKYRSRLQFNTKVILKDGQISLMGEGFPSIAGSLTGKPSNGDLINSYNCDLEDLPMMLLQQVASQVIHWLHEEAMVLGMNVTRDFLCLYFDLDQGETLGLVAHVDPNDAYGLILWYLTVDHPMEEGKMSADNPELEKRRFLGYLSLEVLYSTLMDLINMCSTGVHQ
ncbi:mediator of RNA polymerase II transcription subunit 17-like [Phragmites australis]|uniref:mediator of RNA polymerase II transcription subunit 17-like n=1 Tax=Phragmites australis TaxID=29695 RepID=UPI002D77776F|nr:mediator of RNA polymerase II transcription subunit 17-like [Phragmites australis]XP_062191280.1 mediator of RNA polymerase II transcription subunit 17-like [Phragmites australis]XP_062191285.1 mediator of RNA polymerase II transcription subunit 17-like [Phragmites australis]XP_062191292.1 mediator of RNA polymerase II transcription subunit 17-like [Phragmites australis]XP_062191294.1 mediator of RNA polymerase II transcription subunit 17-like [Phragmites australis]